MLIERSRSSGNGAFNANVMAEIGILENLATQTFIDFVRESGEVVGIDYRARVVKGNQVEEDLQPHLEDLSHGYYVIDSFTSYARNTSAFDLSTRRGMHKEKPQEGEPEYWELSDYQWSFIGSRLMGEIFEPGKYPELLELAIAKKPQLVNPEELPARIMTPEEHRRSATLAKLSQFTVAHLRGVLQLYHRIAYPGTGYESNRGPDTEQLLKNLLAGESVGLRPGTKYLGCAKHQLDVRLRDDQLKTWMYLNYDIPVGPVNLHFREDITMATEFGQQTSAYFVEQGIWVE